MGGEEREERGDKGGLGRGPKREGEGREREKGSEGIGEGEGRKEWASPAHYFRLKSCTVGRQQDRNSIEKVRMADCVSRLDVLVVFFDFVKESQIAMHFSSVKQKKTVA